MGNDSGHARLVFQSPHNGCQRLLALVRIGRWESLNHQDHAVDEWRTKTARQLLCDNFRLATFHPGCSLQMALGAKRKRKEHEDGGKDYAGQPETAQIYKIHELCDRYQ